MAWEGTQLVLLVVCLAVVCSNDTGSDNVGPMVTDKVRPFIYSSTTSLMLSRDGWNPSVCPGTYISCIYVPGLSKQIAGKMFFSDVNRQRRFQESEK